MISQTKLRKLTKMLQQNCKKKKTKKTNKKLQFFPNHCIDLSRQITHPSQHPKNLPMEEESADLHPLAADLQPLAAVS